jgi:hypothetical protein
VQESRRKDKLACKKEKKRSRRGAPVCYILVSFKELTGMKNPTFPNITYYYTQIIAPYK